MKRQRLITDEVCSCCVDTASRTMQQVVMYRDAMGQLVMCMDLMGQQLQLGRYRDSVRQLVMCMDLMVIVGSTQ